MATVTGSQRNKVLVVDTVNTGQGANELYAMNQNVRTSDNVTFNNVTIAGSISGYATESYVGTQISNLVDSSPAALNTLNELAAAIGDDASFSTTVTNSIALKSPLASPTFTGTVTTPNLTIGSGNKIKFANNDYIRYDDAVGVGRFHFDADGGTNNASVQAATFVGALSGNATTATTATNAAKWTTARNLVVTLTGAVTGTATQSVDGTTGKTWTVATTATSDPTLTLAGDVTGSATFTNLGNATLTATVANNSHTHNNLTNYVLKAGDTMTGGLTGTTATFSGNAQVGGALKITEAGTAQNLLIGNQDSGGTNKPAMIMGVNGYLRFGHGSSWSGEGGTFTEKLRVDNDTDVISGNFQIGSTTVIDSSRNLINIGTISSGAITSTVTNTGDATLLTLHHDTGSDLTQQKSFIDFSFEDDNTNETPQVRIGAEVGQNANADSQEKEGSGAFVVYTNNANTTAGSAGTSLAERFRVDYVGNTTSTGIVTATGGNSTNWNTAHGWGNHASAGYVTSSGNTIIGTDTDLSFSGANVLSTIALTDGVITAYTNRVLTPANIGAPELSASYRTTSAVDGAVSSAGWVTVATNTSGRKHGEIIVSDSDSSDHAFIRIDWMRSYADSNFSVLQVGGHSNRITGVRVLSQDSDNTYGVKLLQVYVTTGSTYGVRVNTVGGPRGFGTHSTVTPVIENTKVGYTLHGNELTGLDAVSLAAEEGIKAGGIVYASGGSSTN